MDPLSGVRNRLGVKHGESIEGPGFNIVLVEGGRLATPRRGMFEGTTRRSVFELCADLRIACVENVIAAEQLRQADEVFATSTAGGTIPVTGVDGKAVGDGAPGPVITQLRTLCSQRQEAGWLATRISYGLTLSAGVI